MNNSFHDSLLILTRPLSIFLIVCVLWGTSVKGGYIFDGSGYILGRDFVNMWHYGMSAFFDDPGRFYNNDVYNLKLDQLIDGHNYKNQQFSYPPHFMLLAAPFGWMPYNFAFLLFTALGLGAFWKIVISPLEKPSNIILLTSPAFALALLAGQLSLLLVVIFGTIMQTMDKRLWIAAILIALLTVKPQIGFLFPVYLIATKRYRLFLYATFTSIAFIGISIAFHGIDVWQTYLTSAANSQAERMVDSHPIVLGLMPTLYVNLATLNLPIKIAQIVHIFAASIAIFMMIIIVRRTPNTKLGYITFVATTFATTPYLMVYDTLILVWAILVFGSIIQFNKIDKAAISLLLALPIIGVSMAIAGLTGYAFIIWLLLFCIFKHVWKMPYTVPTNTKVFPSL